LDLIRHVAAVQFSRAAERCARGDSSESGLSKLNSMHGLELHDVWRNAKALRELPLRSSGWPGQVRSTY
jgi:hypothetical protein